MTTANLTPDESFDPRHNVTAKKSDRDLLKLNQPVIDLIATEEECEAMYPLCVYQQMMNRILGQDGEQKAIDAF